MSRRRRSRTSNRNTSEECNRRQTNRRENDERDIQGELERFIGRTVTIFTTSGGESGEGFTGVLLSVDNFVRLLITIGPAPSCALGNSCDRFTTETDEERSSDRRRSSRRRAIRNLGAVVDIPINRIASFVHNAI